MGKMTKEQALQLIEKTADQLKKGGFNFFLFASKPTGARMPGFTEQSILNGYGSDDARLSVYDKIFRFYGPIIRGEI